MAYSVSGTLLTHLLKGLQYSMPIVYGKPKNRVQYGLKLPIEQLEKGSHCSWKSAQTTPVNRGQYFSKFLETLFQYNWNWLTVRLKLFFSTLYIAYRTAGNSTVWIKVRLDFLQYFWNVAHSAAFIIA